MPTHDIIDNRNGNAVNTVQGNRAIEICSPSEVIEYEDEDQDVDCVAMKHRGAAMVYRKTRKMSFQEQVEFWRQESDALRREQEAARLRKKPGGIHR